MLTKNAVPHNKEHKSSRPMELLIVDETDFTPTFSFEYWDSLIWTETYVEPGNFEMTTTQVSYVNLYLEVYTLVTLWDSREVMIVETIEYDIDEYGRQIAIVKGRTLDCFLEYRTIEGPHPKHFLMPQKVTTDQAACIVVWNSLCNPDPEAKSVLMDRHKHGVWYGHTWARIPSTVVTNSVTPNFPLRWRWLKVGQAQEPTFRFLGWQNLGIRCMRPAPAGTPDPGNVRTVWIGQNGYGPYNEAVVAQTPNLRFDIYNGRRNYDINTLRLRYDQGIFENEKRLLNIKDTYNYVLSYPGEQLGMIGEIYANSGLGIDDYQDVGIFFRTYLNVIGTPDSTENAANFQDELDDAGKDFLSENARADIIEVDMAANSQFKYKEDFDLGDIVQVISATHQVRKMRVISYTRISDEQGTREFPTLTNK